MEIKASLQDDVRKEIREIEDKKKRTLNLIIYHMPECTSTNSSVRKEFDIKQFSELCNIIGIQELDIHVCFRLGNFNTSKCRPLKIVLNNKKHRKDILDNASKIRELPQSNQLKKCIITKDLTPQQREMNKVRRQQMQQQANQENLVHMSTLEDEQYNFNNTTITSDTEITNSGINKSKKDANLQNQLHLNNSLSLGSQNILRPLQYQNTIADNSGAINPIDPDETVLGGHFIQSQKNSVNED